MLRGWSVQAIRAASSPEEAAALGRRAEREQPHLLPPDWATVKLSVMLDAVRAKFAQHAGPRAMLLATASGKLGPLEVPAPPLTEHTGRDNVRVTCCSLEVMFVFALGLYDICTTWPQAQRIGGTQGAVEVWVCSS